MVRLAFFVASAGFFAASAGSPGAQVLPPLALPTQAPEVQPPLALPASADVPSPEGLVKPTAGEAQLGPAWIGTPLAPPGRNATDDVALLSTNITTDANVSAAIDSVDLQGGTPDFLEKGAVTRGSWLFTVALVLSGLASAGVFARSRKCGLLGDLVAMRRFQVGDVSQDPLRADWGEWGAHEDDDDVTIGGPLAGGSCLGNSYERPSGI